MLDPEQSRFVLGPFETFIAEVSSSSLSHLDVIPIGFSQQGVIGTPLPGTGALGWGALNGAGTP